MERANLGVLCAVSMVMVLAANGYSASSKTSVIEEPITSEMNCFRYSEWQTTQLTPLSRGNIKFESEFWQRDQIKRFDMVSDLTSQKLVGKSRNSIYKLLGRPRANATKYLWSDPTTQNTDWYELPTQGQCGSAPHYYFVVLYKKNKLRGYRYVTRARCTTLEFARLKQKDSSWHLAN